MLRKGCNEEKVKKDKEKEKREYLRTGKTLHGRLELGKKEEKRKECVGNISEREVEYKKVNGDSPTSFKWMIKNGGNQSGR